MILERKQSACELVAMEAQCLDEQRWNDWLDLYSEDAIFWVPAWKNETELTDDPQTQLSFIYLQGRQFLDERIRRATSGNSVAAMPIPRTTHLVTGSVATSSDDGMTVLVKSSWCSHIYQHKEVSSVCYSGRYEHLLQLEGNEYRIRQKKIVIANDYLTSKLDVFYI